MFHKPISLTFFALSALLFFSCGSPQEVTISGTIDYLGDAELSLKKIPLHYKYSPVEETPLPVDDGSFSATIEVEEPQIIYIQLQDQEYPLFVRPGEDLSLSIQRASFPLKVAVSGTDTEWNEAYISFVEEANRLEGALMEELMGKARIGQPDRTNEISTRILMIAENLLKDTDLHPLYLKKQGEHLVYQIRLVEYYDRHKNDFPTDEERQAVIDKAVEMDFFSLESLTAQRAGIRDFTHYYSRTFGIYDSVNAAYGTTLAEYDIKQVAYEELNEKRMQIIPYIEDRKARAYAEMFLVAERIGELPLEVSEPSYLEYLETYPEYTEYTDFLTYFYNEIKSVSPGQPAVEFSLPDIDGELHTLDEYSGKYVLLDFWAGWCQPCLAEFEDMRRIYNTYSRDDLEILGISTEVDSTVWVNDIQRFQNPWPQLYGGDGFEQETFKAYKGGGIPFYILVDREGNIVRYNDFRPSFNFDEVFEELLANEKN